MHLGSWKRVQTLTLRALQTSGTHPQLHAELCRQTINIIWRYTLVPSRAATFQVFFGSVQFGSVLIFDVGFRLFGSVQATVYCLYFTSKTCTHNVNVYIFSTTNIKCMY